MSETKTKQKVESLGYQAPKGRRLNSGFMTIEADDLHYCESHNFWYNSHENKKLLHFARPCMDNDFRYTDGRHNSYGHGSMLWSRRVGFTLKKAIRLIRKTRNLPVGTIVNITHNCYGIGKKSGKNFSLGFKFKVKKENKFDPKYEISPEFKNTNFTTDEKAKALTDLLRANGFIVFVVSKNPNFLSSLISTAAAYMGNNIAADIEEGEIATAYGHGLRIGYSSNKESFRGYSNGIENILFDKWTHFDKWSRCCEISKLESNERILEILLEEGLNFDDADED